VTFGTLNGVFLAFGIWFGWHYKKTKEAHLDFRQRREKWLQYDTVYKGRTLPYQPSTSQSVEEI
jgi:hypothetical protein